MVKAQAYKLAEFRDEAGMRLHVPDHLQKVFRSLMNLSFDMKKKHPDLKRSVKIDEETLNLYMDIQTAADKGWRRVEAGQAIKADGRRQRNGGSAPTLLGDDEIEGLLGDTNESSK